MSGTLKESEFYSEIVKLRFHLVLDPFGNFNFNKLGSLFSAEEADAMMRRWNETEQMPEALRVFINEKAPDEMAETKTIVRNGVKLYYPADDEPEHQNYYLVKFSRAEQPCYYVLLCFISSRFNLKRGRTVSLDLKGMFDGYYIRPHYGCHLHTIDHVEGTTPIVGLYGDGNWNRGKGKGKGGGRGGGK